MAALAIVMAACSNDSDMNTIENQSQKGKVVTLTTTVSAKSASTRATLTDNGDIDAAWELGDELLVAYNNGKVTTTGKIVSIDANGTATLTAELTDPEENSWVDVMYPRHFNPMLLFDQQDGTLETISKKLFGMIATADLIVDGDKASIPGGLHLEHGNCILKMTLSDGTNDITKDVTHMEMAVQWNEGENTNNRMFNIKGLASLSTIYVIMEAHNYTNIAIKAYTNHGIYSMTQNNVLLEKHKVYTTMPLVLEKEKYNTIQAPDGFKNGGNAFANN